MWRRDSKFDGRGGRLHKEGDFLPADEPSSALRDALQIVRRIHTFLRILTVMSRCLRLPIIWRWIKNAAFPSDLDSPFTAETSGCLVSSSNWRPMATGGNSRSCLHLWHFVLLYRPGNGLGSVQQAKSAKRNGNDRVLPRLLMAQWIWAAGRQKSQQSTTTIKKQSTVHSAQCTSVACKLQSFQQRLNKEEFHHF